MGCWNPHNRMLVLRALAVIGARMVAATLARAVILICALGSTGIGPWLVLLMVLMMMLVRFVVLVLMQVGQRVERGLDVPRVLRGSF